MSGEEIVARLGLLLIGIVLLVAMVGGAAAVIEDVWRACKGLAARQHGCRPPADSAARQRPSDQKSEGHHSRGHPERLS